MNINRRDVIQAMVAAGVLPYLSPALVPYLPKIVDDGDKKEREPPIDYGGYSHIEIYAGEMPPGLEFKPEGDYLAGIPFVRYEPLDSDTIYGYWEGSATRAGIASFFRVVMKDGSAIFDSIKLKSDCDVITSCSWVELWTTHKAID